MDETAHYTATSLATVDIIIVVGFLVLVTVVGFAMSRIASQGIDDYFLGGKKIPWWVLGISTSTSNFDMAGTMIIVALVFALGYKGFLVELRGGVGLSLAFLMVFLGKWLRRSRVMTSAEWMKLRFGTDRQGRAAHMLSAIANLVLSLGMIAYFAKGAGKFLTHFIPLSEVSCTTIMVVVGLLYTLMSGLYGVVFTDVVQMILLSFTAIFITFKAFALTPQVDLPAGFLTLDLEAPTELGAGLLAEDPSTWNSIFQFFGLAVVMWFFRSMLEGSGGVGGYTDQRFFAARTEREASLLTLESIILSILRWVMIAGLVVMGFHLVQSGGPAGEIIAKDPEQVLPLVLGQLLPAGVKGLVIAGLIAAAMSTFDSTLNAGASYWVKDVYQSYINPNATGKQLVRMSHIATIALCVAGIIFAALIPNINTIWGFITTGLGPGMFVPLFLRWYWPRYNGYGFAAGTGAGIVTALTVDWTLGWPLYMSFPTIVGVALAVSVVVALLTPATDDERLVDFWMQINPWGLWGRVVRLAERHKKIDRDQRLTRASEKISDAIAMCLAVPFQLSLLVAGMALVFHDWTKFGFFGTITTVCAVGMYFFWYRNLKSDAQCQEDDAYYEARAAQLAGGAEARAAGEAAE